MGGFGDDDNAVLDQELQGNLNCGLAISLADALENGILEDAVFALGQRAPCFQGDVVGLQIFHHLALLIEHMGFALVHNGHNFGPVHDHRERVGIEI